MARPGPEPVRTRSAVGDGGGRRFAMARPGLERVRTRSAVGDGGRRTFAMARPGPEPGTPRFSGRRRVPAGAAKGLQIAIFSPEQAHAACLAGSAPLRRSMGPMSWDEAFANRYEEWSADMTAAVAFYIDLARQADGPLVELAVGNGRVAIPGRAGDRPAGRRHRRFPSDAGTRPRACG
jgi:hypothetical protein